jgi:predicted metalloprotease with PDZ domain
MQMKKMKTLLSLVAVVALTVPAFAGGDYEKCASGTQECLDKMSAKMQNKGWVGVELEKNEDNGSMSITRVVPGSPAETAGLHDGDVIVAMNGLAFGDEANHEKLSKVWQSLTPGKDVTYTVNRHGHDKDVTVTLANVPDDVMASWVGRHMLEHAAVDVAQD